MSAFPDFSEFKTDTLFLTLGTNPLPVYVALRLLTRPTTRVYLICTAEVAFYADKIINAFPDLTIEKLIVAPADTARIRAEVLKEAVPARERGLIGLHYTGGTRPMSVSSYLAVQQADPQAVFSYLDARDLALRIDRDGLSLALSTRGLQVKLEDLIGLHGYQADAGHPSPMAKDEAAEVVAIFSRVYADRGLKGYKEFYKAWSDWLYKNLEPFMSKKNQANRRKLEQIELPTQPPLDVFASIWDGYSTLGDFAGSRNIFMVARWLHGLWLEDYTLNCVQKCAKEAELHTWASTLIPRLSTIDPAKAPLERQFELDVYALRDYRFYLLSCSTTYTKGLLKEKLFEAFTRTRQIGGEEARAALVSCCLPAHPDNPSSSPLQVQQDAQELWDAHQQVRVFGLEHLPNLTHYLTEWFKFT